MALSAVQAIDKTDCEHGGEAINAVLDRRTGGGKGGGKNGNGNVPNPLCFGKCLCFHVGKLCSFPVNALNQSKGIDRSQKVDEQFGREGKKMEPHPGESMRLRRLLDPFCFQAITLKHAAFGARIPRRRR